MFVREEEGKIEKAAKEKRGIGGNVSNANKSMMRLIEAYFLDEHRTLMIRRNNFLGRQELDARNSEQRNPTYFELVAKTFNDPLWIPHTSTFPDLHIELTESFPLPLASKPQVCDTETIVEPVILNLRTY